MNRSDDKQPPDHAFNDEDIAALFDAAPSTGEPSAATDAAIRALAGQTPRATRGQRYRWLGTAAVAVLAVALVPLLQQSDTPMRDQGTPEALSSPSRAEPQPAQELAAPSLSQEQQRHAAPAALSDTLQRAAKSSQDGAARGAAAGDGDSPVWRDDALRWLDTIRQLVGSERLDEASREATLFRQRHARDPELIQQLEAIMADPDHSDPSPR